MYGKHLHIRQNVVLIYHFLLVVSSPIEDHYHDPKRKQFSFQKIKKRSIHTRINFSKLFHVSKSVSIVNHVYGFAAICNDLILSSDALSSSKSYRASSRTVLNRSCASIRAWKEEE
jgi:hypothetical protein